MSNEKLFTLIKSPIITEQTALLGENLKQVVFKVDLSANKREINYSKDQIIETKNYQELVIMVGYPGSGKTTLANKIFNDSEKVPWTTISKAKAELVKASNDSRFADMKDEVEIIKKYIDDLEKDFSS